MSRQRGDLVLAVLEHGVMDRAADTVCARAGQRRHSSVAGSLIVT